MSPSPRDTSPRDTSADGGVQASARAFAEEALHLEHVALSLLGVEQHPVFRVTSDAGTFILKVFSRDDLGWRRERAGLTLFGDSHAPRLLAESESGWHAMLLSELVPGRDLRHHLLRGADDRFVERALQHSQEILDDIHRRLASSSSALDGVVASDPLLTLTAADTLRDRLTRALRPARLGPKRCDQVIALIDARPELGLLLRDTCIGHGDFQAKNIVVGDDGTIRVIDWEMLRRGPRVADPISLRRFRSWPGARVPEEVAVPYDLLKVALGVSRSVGWSDDLPVWLGYIDACIDFLDCGDRPALAAATARLLTLV